MKQFLTRGEFAYHAKGAYIPSVDEYNVNISTTYSASRDPDFHRNVLNLTLDGAELDALIVTLQNIRASKPASLPVEDYGWLNRVEVDKGTETGDIVQPTFVGNCRVAIQDERNVWSGYEEGRKTREKHSFDRLDTLGGTVAVVIPEHAWTITSSYFRGLFGESLENLGGSGFLNHYTIFAKPEIKTLLMDHVSISYWKNPWHK